MSFNQGLRVRTEELTAWEANAAISLLCKGEEGGSCADWLQKGKRGDRRGSRANGRRNNHPKAVKARLEIAGGRRGTKGGKEAEL